MNLPDFLGEDSVSPIAGPETQSKASILVHDVSPALRY